MFLFIFVWIVGVNMRIMITVLSFRGRPTVEIEIIPEIDPCGLEMSRGPCRAIKSRWFFNKNSGNCEVRIIKGIYGKLIFCVGAPLKSIGFLAFAKDLLFPQPKTGFPKKYL